jgi:hypothetical protein
MKSISIKNILKSVIISLLIFAVAFSLIASLRGREFNLMGLVIAVYYLIPVILFTLTFVASLTSLMRGKKAIAELLISQIVIALLIGLLFLTLWVVYDGGAYHYDKLPFFTYWVRELKIYWLPIVYFGVTIPAILYTLSKLKKQDGK